YGLALKHKHLPELQRYGGLTRAPIFVPSVGNFSQGMLVSVPLHLDALPKRPSVSELRDTLAAHYSETTIGASPLVTVASAGSAEEGSGRLAAPLSDTDQMTVFVFGREDTRHAVLIARLDNLGKGASGAAIQNLRLALGLN
ncbi:MAG: N-acetyl-gamma-glutamyl-phosphate reductase, partial [Pseudomonadota bacterium]